MAVGNSVVLFVMAVLTTTMIVFQNVGMAASSIPSQIALPGCPEKCGNISIPYPFGIGDKCCFDEDYNLTCDRTTNPPTVIHSSGVEVVKITLDGELWVRNSVSYVCYDDTGLVEKNITRQIGMKRFPLSTTQNSLLAIGCNIQAGFQGITMTNMNETEEYGQFQIGCTTTAECNCKAAIPRGVTNTTLTVTSMFSDFYRRCKVAFAVANDVLPPLESFLTKDISYFQNLKLPVVYDWLVGTQSCKYMDSLDPELSICIGSNSECIDIPEIPDGWGFRCQCYPGFQGYPYLHDCKDIDECAEGINLCEKRARCVNTIGSYNCTCPLGYSHSNGNVTGPCIADESGARMSTEVKVIVGVGVGITVTIVLASCVCWRREKRKLLKARQSFFRQNGGHLLHQKLSDGRDVSVDMFKIFNIEELEKATNKYSESNIIGKGGFGVVYKGILPNHQEIAIKKSLKVDANQSEQFINEVIVLSQLNNRHVVKILGCCLETEVPLLVYEFIDNGTLYDHLHGETKASLLTWDIRLRIALEVAEVLSYLHITISIPIIHRDMKSMNILLDKNYMAKVSDFGASKLVPMNEDNLVTMVLGTYGYLDPEYFQTSELTQKSDVYSFGVVLVELLTREKAVSFTRPENDRCLAFYFLRKLKEGRLDDILDKVVINRDTHHQVMELADLARRCLDVKGDGRPTMKEVATELQRIEWITDGARCGSRIDVMSQEEKAHELLDGSLRLGVHGCDMGNTKDSSSSQYNSSIYESLEYGR